MCIRDSITADAGQGSPGPGQATAWCRKRYSATTLELIGSNGPGADGAGTNPEIRRIKGWLDLDIFMGHVTVDHYKKAWSLAKAEQPKPYPAVFNPDLVFEDNDAYDATLGLSKPK